MQEMKLQGMEKGMELLLPNKMVFELQRMKRNEDLRIICWVVRLPAEGANVWLSVRILE
jgi:hypothetical protein